MNAPEVLLNWMQAEYKYSSAKFGDHQVESLTTVPISNNAVFGGQAALYWSRMRMFDRGEAVAQRTQAAAKMANATRSLWSTLRAFDWSSDKHSTNDSLMIIRAHLGEHDFHNGKQLEERDDFWETPIGLGLTYLEHHIKRHGFAQKFRLSQLIRAEQIMTDASEVAALQFERCLEAHGAVPKPGLSSGNIELWLPENA